jgi:hypothetical protein
MLKTIWPSQLSVFYPHPAGRLAPLAAVGAAVFSVAVTILAVRWRKRHPCVAVGWFWYVGMLFPAIGLVQVGAQSMADRYTYLPLVGLFVAICWALPRTALTGYRRAVAIGASVVLLVVLSWLTDKQVAVWKNPITLFEHAVRIDTDNPLAHNNLAAAYFSAGDADKAAHHLVAALRIDPDDPVPRLNLSAVLFSTGQLDKAKAQASRVVAAHPEHSGARRLLHRITQEQSRRSQSDHRATKTIQNARRRRPG